MTEFDLCTKIFFGAGSLEHLRSIKDKKVLIITDTFIYSSGIAKKVGEVLSGCEISYFKEITVEPEIAVICAGVSCLLKTKAEIMVAVGGGSALDAAKAIRNMAEQIYPNQVHIEECIAIPTTSGTGSEVTEFAVITDPEKKIKYPLHDDGMRPTIAILEPTLVASIPPAVTADTGMDVLTHAIEAYVSLNANDFSDALAEKAVTLVMKFLPVAYLKGDDMLAREKMHNASCMAGLAFSSAGLGLNHGIAHGLGAHLHLPHGRANAILLPHTIEYNANIKDCRSGSFSVAARKYQRLAKIIGLPADTELIGIDQLRMAIVKLNQALRIPPDLKAANCELDSESKEQIADSALKDVTTQTNPRIPNKQDVFYILDKCRG